VRWFEGVGAPVKDPQQLDVVIFRENTEDVYAGIEWKAGAPRRQAARVPRARVRQPDPRGLGARHQADVGVRLQAPRRDGDRYAITNNRPSVTLVHKGNIMKYTEGASATGATRSRASTFGGRAAARPTWRRWAAPRARMRVVKDRIADSMFQQILLRPPTTR
jgi:isocitrate dehydrogenase